MGESKRGWIWWGAVVLLSGCHGRPPSTEQVAELQQVQDEARQLNENLDQLEARLLESKSRVQQAQLLRERHGQVSQVACQNLSEHWDGISRFISNQKEKERQKRRAKVAQVEVNTTRE